MGASWQACLGTLALLTVPVAACGDGTDGSTSGQTAPEEAKSDPGHLLEPTAAARREIGAARIAAYRRAGRETDLDWGIIAAVDQEEGGEVNPLAIAYALAASGAPLNYETALRARGGSISYVRRVLRRADRIRTVSAGARVPASERPMRRPVPGHLLATFGKRFGLFHDGIDWNASDGEPIHAAAAGVVIQAGQRPPYGNFTCLAHRFDPPLRGAGRIVTCYGHLRTIAVHAGQRVARGEVIGRAGCTGTCTSPRLHFQLRIGRSPLAPAEDPLLFFAGG